MPTECLTNPLQRELADSIIRLATLDDIRILLACGAKVNEPVTQGLRPLHYAVWQRYKEATQLLLVRGCDVNAKDDCGYSALHLCAEHGYVDIMQMLLEHKVQVDYREIVVDDMFPLTQLCDEPLRLAIKNNHYEAARLLLEHGANSNARYFFGSEINLLSPLNTEYLELLLKYGADPDMRDRSGLTPLMKACRLTQGMESVLLLLSYGADVNAMTDERHDYRTVLHYAILSGNYDIVHLLLKQGARVNFSPDYQKPTPLDLAILKGDPTLVKILVDAGADVNASSPIIGSPLHVACADNVPNRLDTMSLLLHRGADPNRIIPDDDGRPLKPVLGEYISSNENPSLEVVELLLRHGAKVVLKTQHRDPLGILSHLGNAVRQPRVLWALLDAAESFDSCMIRRSQQLPDLEKQVVMNMARTPLTLKHQARLFLRKHLGTGLCQYIDELQLPKSLNQYLLYEIS